MEDSKKGIYDENGTVGIYMNTEYYEKVLENRKNFIVVRKKGVKIGDFLCIRESEKGEHTGREVVKEVIYKEDVEEGLEVLGYKEVPLSFVKYKELTEKEKGVFLKLVATLGTKLMEQRPYYMGEIEEEGFNCMVEILIGVRGLDNEEIMWYSDLYKRKYNNVTE